MKQLLPFIRKEFYHVFRDRRTLLILFGLPVVQIVLFGFALTSEVKNVNIVICGNAGDAVSQAIVRKIQASSYFTLQQAQVDYPDIEKAFKKGIIKAALVFPSSFNNDLIRTNKAQVQIIADASDPNTAKAIINYLSAIIADYNQSLNPSTNIGYRITPQTRMLYNEEGNGSLMFVPGVLALILMLVCTALTSVSVVRERETGTMEVLLVSPFKPVFVLFAKTIPFLVLSLANVVLILTLSVFVLHVPIAGSVVLLFLETMLFIITCLSLGLLISNVAQSQQAALMLSITLMMMPTLIFTGFIFPLENMPVVFQWISNIIPARWYYRITKAVMLKGLGFGYVWKETGVLLGLTLFFLMVSLKKFKTRLA